MLSEEIIASLEAIVRRDAGRNVDLLGREARGGLLDAARSIVDCPDPVPAIMTGAFMPWADPPAPETDGPIGTAELAVGLHEAGVAVRVVTDSICEGVMRTALVAAGPHDIPLDVIPASGAEGAMSELAAQYSDSYGVTHVIAVERLGPAFDGCVYDMSGRDISTFTVPLHELFSAGGWKRIGIGDGGNELGMGSLSREAVTASVPAGDRIHCSIPCDHLIVSATSNWGAQALLAAIAVLWEDRADALLARFSAEHDNKILRDVVSNSEAVDGVKQRQSPSVDGIDASKLARVISELLVAIGRVDAT